MSGKNHKLKNARIPFAENTHAIETLSPCCRGSNQYFSASSCRWLSCKPNASSKAGATQKELKSNLKSALAFAIRLPQPNITKLHVAYLAPKQKSAKKTHDKNKMKSGSWPIHFKYVPKHCFAQLFLHVPSCSI
jgi:hypothetical protein